MLSFAYTKSRFTLFRLSYAPSDKRASVSSADALLFCLFRKKRRKLSHAHGQASITIRIPSPFRRFRRRAEALRAFFAVRIPAEPPLRLSFSPAAAPRCSPVPLRQKRRAAGSLGFSVRPETDKIASGTRRRPTLRFLAPQRLLRPVFAICARFSCKTALTIFRQPLDKSPRECYDRNELRSYIGNL